MKFKLYEISKLLEDAMIEAEQLIDNETGEIPDDWYEFLDAIQMERNEKCLSVAKVIKSFSAEAEAIKSEENNLKCRRKKLENKTEKLKKYLSININEGEKLSDSCVVISWRKSSSVVVDNEFLIPDELCTIKRTPQLTEIKRLLLSGNNLIDSNAAHIENKQNLQVR